MTTTLLWTISGEGIARLVPALAYLLSGLVVPLPLLPDWAQPVMNALPFRGLLDVPLRIWLGHMSGGDALVAIAQQAIWTVVFVVAGRALVARGIRKLVVQGG